MASIWHISISVDTTNFLGLLLILGICTQNDDTVEIHTQAGTYIQNPDSSCACPAKLVKVDTIIIGGGWHQLLSPMLIKGVGASTNYY